MSVELRSQIYLLLKDFFCSVNGALGTIRCKNLREENGSLLRDQGGLLYKAPLTATVFKDFSSCYQHFSSQHSSKNPDEPFVYVDSDGVKLVTGVVDDQSSSDGIFALSVAGDGFVEMLAMHEAS